MTEKPSHRVVRPALRALAALAALAGMLAGTPAPASAQERPVIDETPRVPEALRAVGPDAENGPVRRIPLPSRTDAGSYPYTIEIPADWQVLREIPQPGIFLGPESGSPDEHPEMILVRPSAADASDLPALVETIRGNLPRVPWEAGELEIRTLGDDLEGLWLRMDVDRESPRKTVVLKLPLPEGGSVDVLGSAPAERYPELAEHYERILMSVRPVETDAGS